MGSSRSRLRLPVDVEATVLRKMTFLAGFLWILIPTTPACAQDQPSLGDVARQARKDKEKNNAQPKKVITDDTLPSSKGLSGVALADLSASQGSDDGGGMARALAGLKQAEAALDKMGPMDRATLAKAALLDNDVDFPNRRGWEEKLYSAKEQYVSHGRELFQEMRQILVDIQSLRSSQGGVGKLSPDDPRAQQMMRRIQEIVQDAVRTDRAYQTIVVEGWDLAKQAKH
jgi:hypothetical protein